jgi:hypothetical protein
VLLGKALDFTTKWAAGPAFDPDVRLIAIDPDQELVNRAKIEKGRQFVTGCVADPDNATQALLARAGKREGRKSEWHRDARSALESRPVAWRKIAATTQDRLHPAGVPDTSHLHRARS